MDFINDSDSRGDTGTGDSQSSAEDSDHNSESDKQERDVLPLIITSGKFYKFIRYCQKSSVEAQCLFCNKKIKGRVSTSSNFITHLKRRHSEQQKEFVEYKTNLERSGSKRKCDCVSSSNNISTPLVKKKLKQTKLFQSESFNKNGPNTPNRNLTQENVDKLIINYIVKGMHTLETVSEDSFKELINGLTGNNNLKVMSRRTLGRKIDELAQSYVESLKFKLHKKEYLCVTVDIWSMNIRSFIGMTVHWLEEDLHRESATLACRRFKGIHSFDKITDMIENILCEFNINLNKIVGTVTDNGSNFIKAFRVFGLNLEDYDENEDTEEVIDDEVILVDVEDLRNIERNRTKETLDGDGARLSYHIKCAAHSLSLVGTTDAQKALNDKSFSKLNKTVMGKLSTLWNCSNRPRTGETLKNILGCSLQRPCPTRWNSFYDSISQILKIGESQHDETVGIDEINSVTRCPKLEKLDSAMEAVSITKLTANEKKFLLEYSLILQPLAMALDHLQSQNNCYYATFLPTLVALRTKLERIPLNKVQSCVPLLTAVISGLEKRFHEYFNLDYKAKYAILATISHPFYKLRWLPTTVPEDKKTFLKEMLVKEALTLTAAKNTVSLLPSSNTTNDTAKKCCHRENFYEFETEESECSETGTGDHRRLVELEVLKYLLCSQTNIETLREYPSIREVFKKYNVLLPSSAPVERLFSFAGMIFAPKRRRLSDDNFEKLLLLREI